MDYATVVTVLLVTVIICTTALVITGVIVGYLRARHGVPERAPRTPR